MGNHAKQYQWFRREVYPLWSLFPLRGTSTVYPQLAFGISTNMPELFNRHLKQHRQMSIVVLNL
jgi:hypothetical protein